MFGMSMDHVKVHYNSDKPVQLNAHAYAQGSEIHVVSVRNNIFLMRFGMLFSRLKVVKPTMQMKTGTQSMMTLGLKQKQMMGAKGWELEQHS